MTAAKTASKARQTAEQAAKAAKLAQETVKALSNSPDKIESLAMRLVIWALISVPLYFFWTNRDPYISALEGVTGDQNWLIGLIGLAAVTAVQYFEIKPFLLPSTTNNAMRRHWQRIALGAYALDISVCYHRWPVFKEIEYGLPGLGDINYSSIGSITAIVFGFSIWFTIRKLAARKA